MNSVPSAFPLSGGIVGDSYTPSLVKAKEHDALTDAVRIENQRIYALAAQSRQVLDSKCV